MQSTIRILKAVALAASFLSVVASTPVAQEPGVNPNKDRSNAIRRVRPRPLLRPDLVVLIRAPRTANAGDEIGRDISIRAHNRGTAPAPGTVGRIDPDDGYIIDVVLSTDALLPDGFANPSANFIEDMLLRGGRISRTADLAAGAARGYPVGATIPADTPTGRYFLCARIDSGNKVVESNEHNNTACYPIAISVSTDRPNANECGGMLIEKIVPNVTFPGGTIAINGRNFGRRQGTKIPAINRGHVDHLQVIRWTDTQILARAPLDLVGGTYRVLIYCDNTYRTSSNSLEVTVRDDIHRPR